MMKRILKFGAILCAILAGANAEVSEFEIKKAKFLASDENFYNITRQISDYFMTHEKIGEISEMVETELPVKIGDEICFDVIILNKEKAIIGAFANDSGVCAQALEGSEGAKVIKNSLNEAVEIYRKHDEGKKFAVQQVMKAETGFTVEQIFEFLEQNIIPIHMSTLLETRASGSPICLSG